MRGALREAARQALDGRRLIPRGRERADELEAAGADAGGIGPLGLCLHGVGSYPMPDARGLPQRPTTTRSRAAAGPSRVLGRPAGVRDYRAAPDAARCSNCTPPLSSDHGLSDRRVHAVRASVPDPDELHAAPSALPKLRGRRRHRTGYAPRSERRPRAPEVGAGSRASRLPPDRCRRAAAARSTSGRSGCEPGSIDTARAGSRSGGDATRFGQTTDRSGTRSAGRVERERQ